MTRPVDQESVQQRAQRVFETWAAGLQEPRNQYAVLSQIQCRLSSWQTRNFGHQPSANLALGIGEELTELIDAECQLDKASVADAVGDICVFLMNLLTGERLDFNACWGQRYTVQREPEVLRAVCTAVGRVLRAVLKHEQKIRGMSDPLFYRTALAEAAHDTAVALHQLLHAYRLDLEDVIVATAESVMRRDWNQARATGQAAPVLKQEEG